MFGVMAIWCVIWLHGGALAAARQTEAPRYVPPTMQFRQAWRAEVPLDVPPVHGAFLAPGLQLELPPASLMHPPPAGAGWRQVGLPDLIRQDVATSVEAPRQVSLIWYRLSYPALPAVGDAQTRARTHTRLSVYIPRAPGGAAHVFARARHGWVVLLDNREEWANQWNRPLIAHVPPELLPTDGPLELAIALPHAMGAPHGLTTVWVGPRDTLMARWAWRWDLQVTVPQVVSLSILVLGLFSLAAWARQRHEPTYWMFGLISLTWALRNVHLWANVPTTLEGQAWHWWLAKVTVPWFIALPLVFAYRFQPVRYPRVEAVFLAYAVWRTLLTLPLWHWSVDTTLIEYGLDVTLAGIAAALMTRDAWQRGSRELIVITGTFWLGIAFGVHDLMMIAQFASLESVLLTPVTTLCFTASFLYALHRRYLRALVHTEALNASLESRVAQQRSELEASHQRLRDVEQQQVRLLERQRLMRDMHDGVGSALITSLAMVERGQLRPDEVAQVLRDCVDDLRMVIESLEPIGHDLLTLLGALRFRLGKRLGAAGLKLNWQMNELPPLPWLDPTEALQVLRLVQEVFTNVIKHAQAAHLTVQAEVAEGGAHVWVCITDDGQGFDPAAAHAGKGLHGMRERARRIGGEVLVRSQPGQGTEVRLVLPLARPAA
jgi:signal transduction histidine kinase